MHRSTNLRAQPGFAPYEAQDDGFVATWIVDGEQAFLHGRGAVGMPEDDTKVVGVIICIA